MTQQLRALVAEALRVWPPSAVRTPNDPAPIERSADRRDVVVFTGYPDVAAWRPGNALPLLIAVTPTTVIVPICHSLTSYREWLETQQVRRQRGEMLSSSTFGEDVASDDEIGGNSSRSRFDLSAQRAEREPRHADLE